MAQKKQAVRPCEDDTTQTSYSWDKLYVSILMCNNYIALYRIALVAGVLLNEAILVE